VKRFLWCLRAVAIRALGVQHCGAFGGIWHIEPDKSVQRWCLKPFGHDDSCWYDERPDQPNSQPGYVLRAKFRGWR
jgi:hypothetical protein